MKTIDELKAHTAELIKNTTAMNNSTMSKVGNSKGWVIIAACSASFSLGLAFSSVLRVALS